MSGLISQALSLLRKKKDGGPRKSEKLDALGKIVEQMRTEEVEDEVMALKEQMVKPLLMRLINQELGEPTADEDEALKEIAKRIKEMRG